MRLACLAGAFALLAALIIYGVARPGPEEKEYNRLKGVMVDDFVASGKNLEKMDKTQRDEIRASFEKLSPETREKLATEIMRAHLGKAREEFAPLTEQQKAERVEKMIVDARKHFTKMSEQDREKAKADFKSAEGQTRFAKALKNYNSEFSAKERELFDPLVEEILMQINAL